MKKLTLICALLATACADAAVSLPRIFGDNMVLQRGQKVPVWGKAEPGESVTVTFAGQSVRTKADRDGRWRLDLAPLSASVDGRDFIVNTLPLTNVVVGEVWFCSGQSNMEFPMGGLPWDATRRIKDSAREIAAAQHPLLRHFKTDRVIAEEPKDDVKGYWEPTTPASVMRQSAVAYIFGETLLKELKVPVGLINCSWGGTRIEPWTPAGHRDDLWLLQHLKRWDRPYDVPTVLWNGMVAGLVPYAIKGAIWYQGCSNRDDGEAYIDKTVALVRGWRREWGQGDFPYFLIQLAPFKYDNPKGSILPVFQEVQARIPDRVPNCGYTVINDVGNVEDIHPTDKRTVGQRVADQVLDRVYGQRVRPWKTPVATKMTLEGAAVRVAFDAAEGLTTRDGKAPTEFELRDLTGAWVPATARIEGASVVLQAQGVTAPLGVRFAPYNASTPNLVNGAGLPAGPFHLGRPCPLGAAELLPRSNGLTCVQRYDIAANCDLNAVRPTLLASVPNVSRVGYLLELVGKNADTVYVYAEMDAFAPTSEALVLTSDPKARLIRRPVAHLTVRSNSAAVRPRTDCATGFLEFYTTNYSPRKGDTPDGGDERKYDFNDLPQPEARPDLGYGCLQLHDLATRETLFGFSHFNSASVPCDLGIGTCRGEHPDWTFARNGDSYAARRLSVWVKP